MKLTRKGSRILALAVCIVMLLAVAAPAMALSVAGYGSIQVTTSTVYKDAKKSAVIGYFKYSEYVAIYSQTNGMYRVLTSAAGETGYIAMSEVGQVTSNLPSNRGIAYISTSAGTSTPTTNTVSSSSSNTSSSTSSSTSGNSTSGNSSSSSSSNNTSTSAGVTAVVATGVVNASNTRMYKDSNGTSSMQTINTGGVVSITGQTSDGKYYQCKYNGSTGFVEQAKVTLLPADSSASGTGVVNANSVKLYKYAYVTTSTSSSLLVGTLSKNTKVALTAEAGTLYKVTAGSRTGYVEKTAVTLDAGASTGNSTGGSSSGGSSSSGGISTVNGNVKVMPGSSSPTSSISSKLAAAKKKSKDVVGYIELSGTNISEPILSKGSSDPYYYLDRDINGKKSSAGCATSFYNVLVRNNVLTGHNMRVSGTLFHQLHHLQEKALGKSKCMYSKCKSSSLAKVANMKTDASARVWNINLHGYNQWEVWAMYEVAAKEPKATLTKNINTLNSYSEAQRTSWINDQLTRAKKDGIAFGSASADDILLTIYTCGTNYDSATAQSRLFFFLKAVK